MFIKKIIFITLLLSGSLAKASALYDNLVEKSHNVLAEKSNALDLESVKQMVISEDVDIKIAYQRLLQAQKDISVARAQYFPYGTGLIFNYNSYAVWNDLILVELVTSLPTKFYNVRKNKNLATAQSYHLEALKENIKNEVAKIYYGILKQEAVIKLVELELQLLETIYAVAQEHVVVGLKTENDLLAIQRRTLNLRDDLLKFKGYHLKEREVFYNFLATTAYEAEGIELQPIRTYLTGDELKLSTEEMIELSIRNAPELRAADFMISAAYNEKKSVQWSLLSFSGIGFGYWGRVNISQSKLNEMNLAKIRTENTIVNQVYTKKSEFKNNIGYLQSEIEILKETKSFMDANYGLYSTGEIDLTELLESQIIYLKDYREVIMANYTALASLDNLHRITLSDVTVGQEHLTQESMSALEEETGLYTASLDAKLQGRRLKIWISSDSLQEIEKVDYIFDTESRLKPMTSSSIRRKFRIKIRTLRKFKPISGTYIVYFKDGSKQIKKFRIK